MSNASLARILQRKSDIDKLNFTRNTNFNIMEPNTHTLEKDKLKYNKLTNIGDKKEE